jgi:hypothetical protein
MPSSSESRCTGLSLHQKQRRAATGESPVQDRRYGRVWYETYVVDGGAQGRSVEAMEGRGVRHPCLFVCLWRFQALTLRAALVYTSPHES